MKGKSSEAFLERHQHGKSRVRVARVWRGADGKNVFAEYQVQTTLLSAMEHAYVEGSNEGMTATDTQKNMCYLVAKQLKSPCSVEEYALALGRKFVDEYPLVSTAIIAIEQKPWQRVSVANQPHNHGFATTGCETRTTKVEVHRTGTYEILSGFKDLRLCKTTQSGYEGFLHDQYTLLPDTRERLLASSITCTWRYYSTANSFDEQYEAIKESIIEAFFGHPKTGKYSPSVQKTLYEMGEAVIDGFPSVDWVFRRSISIFIPVLCGSKRVAINHHFFFSPIFFVVFVTSLRFHDKPFMMGIKIFHQILVILFLLVICAGCRCLFEIGIDIEFAACVTLWLRWDLYVCYSHSRFVWFRAH